MVSWILGTLLGAAVLTAAGGIGAGEKKEGSGALGTAPGKEPSANADRPVGSEVDFRKLVGQWKRTDRDFRIVIQRIDADGRMDAAYLNPRPINIALAEAFQEGETVKIYIVLWDEGYAGGTYELTYLLKRDALSGTYYPPTTGKRFPVVFTRAR